MEYEISLEDSIYNSIYVLPRVKETVVGRFDSTYETWHHVFRKERGRIAITPLKSEIFTELWESISKGHVYIFRYDLEGHIFEESNGDFEFGVGNEADDTKKTLRDFESLFTISDKRSKNGTYLNKVMIPKKQEMFVRTGDVIALGGYELVFKVKRTDKDNS